MTCVVINADCMDAMRELIDKGEQVDSIVTDPPYELGFMGKAWDKSGIANDPELWKLCLQILKPGGHLLSFGGSRTYHRMACAIEDAGFEIRDQIMWVYGQGFPKSLNVGNGFGTALKPAHEPIVLARKPLSEKTIAANVLKHGTGAINVDWCRVGTENIRIHGYKGDSFSQSYKDNNSKPELNDYKNVQGRFPANLIHDGSEEVEEEFAKYGVKKTGSLKPYIRTNREGWSGDMSETSTCERNGDTGSASRFFYCAKASKKDRNGSKHPTVKPIALMRYLCRLITPPGGLILDPFAGSGTTAQAAIEEGFNAILIEKEKEYVDDINNRIQIKNN